ncbi:hypothetical protein BC835DRAFT_1309388 [Cytidiella melzeri]|nr:hypothetical protein BC835DRAFT_1309388 [Cytidiella melzeri]
MIAPIRLNSSRQAPVPTATLPDPVRRAGRFLLERLRIEYNECKAPICGLREDEAVDLLKDQVGKYYRGEAPFDRPITGEEGPRKQQLTDCEQQLATYLMGLTPNSMSDERTASYFTWQNSHLRGAQKVSTLVRMAQIQQFKKNQVLDSHKVKRPTVKFRDLRSTLHVRQDRDPDLLEVRVEGEAGRAEADDSTASEDEVESDEGGDRASEIEDFAEWGAQSRRTRQKYDDEPGERFVVSDMANLQSHALRDLLSDIPLATTKQPQSVVPRGPPRKLQESDWTM